MKDFHKTLQFWPWEDEIQYLINECEKYLSPNLQVRRRDSAFINLWISWRLCNVLQHHILTLSTCRNKGQSCSSTFVFAANLLLGLH